MSAIAGTANLSAEALIETGQGNITGMVQMLAHEFEELMPDKDFYNGEDGVFDGWWGQYAAAFIQVAPAGVMAGMSQKGSIEQAVARKEMSYDERTMIGISKEDNDAYEAATTTGEIFGVYKNVEPNRNPWSDESKAKVEEFVEEQKAKQERTDKAIANLTKKGMMPIIRTDKTQKGVVELIHPETGDVLTRTDDPRVAADSVVAHLELDDQVNQDRMDELVGMIETAVLDVQDTAYKKGKVSVEMGELMDVERILAMYPEFKNRAMAQVDRLENLEDREILNGGDGRMTRAVYGMSVQENEAEQKGFLQRIFGGRTNAMTLVHERGHAKFREALDSGAITLKEAFDFFTNLDKALEGKTGRKGERLSFLADGATETDFASIDEAVAEFHEVMLLRTRNGKKSQMRQAVGRQLSAMVKAQTPGATKLKAFYDAMQDFFSKLLARNLYMKQAVKQGLLNEADVEKFRMALQGTTEQEAFNSEVATEASEIMDVPFSIGAERNAGYLSAVKSGDMDTAQAMVDAKAKEAGYDVTAFHGTKADPFQIFETSESEMGSHFGGINQAQTFGSNVGKYVLNISNPLRVEDMGVFDPLNVASQMVDAGIIDDKFIDIVERQSSKDAIKLVQKELQYLGYDGLVYVNRREGVDVSESDRGTFDMEATDAEFVERYPDASESYVVFSPNQIKSADPVTYDSDGNVIPLSQRFDEGRDEISMSIGDTQMKDTLWTQAYTRAKSPEKRMTVMKNLMDRIEALRRDVPRIIKAFGKEFKQQPLVDRRLVGELRADANKMRRNLVEEAENAVYDRYGEILSNEDLVSLKSQPVTELVLVEGGIESLTSAKRRNNDNQLKAGEFEAAAGLPVMYYGGARTPDQMAQELHAEGLISDDGVETMMEAINAEMVSVSNRKSELADAKKSLAAAKKAARAESDAWLEERLAEQDRDYNVMDRAHRALVTFEAIRMSLPMELRGKIKGDAKLLSIKSDEKRLEYLEDAIAKLDKIVETWIKKETTKEINTAFDRILKLKKGTNVRKSKTVAEIHAEVKLIKRISTMSEDAINTELQKINEDSQLTQDGEEQSKLELDMVRLITFGNMKAQSGSQLSDYLANVLELEKSGLLKREVLDQLEREELAADIALTNDEVTGGKGRMLPSVEALKSEKEDTKWLTSKLSGLNQFHTHNVSFEWIMNKLSRNSGKATFAGGIHRRFAVMSHKSTRQESVMNMNSSREQDNFFKSLFGIKGKNKLSQAIDEQLLRRKKTGIMREFYPDGGSVKKNLKASNIVAIIEGRADADSLGLSEAEVESAKSDYYAKLNKKQSQKNMGGKVATLSGNTKITYQTDPKGVKDEIVASQSQAVAYIMMFRQDGMRESMIREGYTEEAMEQLENEFLTDKAKLLMDWLTVKYDENYDVVNAVFREQNGIDLPKIDFYSPLKRIAEGKVKDLTIEGDKQALSTTPAFVFDRTRNFAEMDTNADAISIFNNHILQTNHYVSWAKTIKRLRGVFQNTDVQRNITDYVGKGVNKIIQDRINWQADGGNRNATQWGVVNRLRSGVTLSALSWNPGIGYKQLSSAPAYINEMGFNNFAKYQALFFKDLRKNIKEMWSTDYVQTRFKEGYDREVKDALRVKGKSKIGRWSISALQNGMSFTKWGDIIPVLAGGWAMKKYTYDKSIATMTHADAEAEAMLQFEMVTDRYQQASNAKDLNTFQGGDSITRLFTMFLTSPNQYYAGVAEAVLDWKAGREGGRQRAIRAIIVGHVILPTMFRLATDTWNHVFDEEDHEWSINEYGKSMLLGGFNGLFMAGQGIASITGAVTQSKVWDSSTPWGDIMDDLADGVSSMTEGDLLESIDSLMEATGKLAPSPVTFYAILKRRLEWLYD